MNCYIVQATSKVKRNNSSSSYPDIRLDEYNIKKYMHAVSVKDVLMEFNRYSRIPIIDETSVNEKIDVEFPDNYNRSSQADILEILKSAGFRATREERELKTVIISDHESIAK